MNENFYLKLKKAVEWQPPAEWMKISTLDLHTAGEPLRVLIQGFPELPGDTMLARRRNAREMYDDLRKALMWEPRGHADMYGCIITSPTTPQGDLGVLFLHNEGFSTMCGHGIIAVTRAVLETGMFEMQEPVTTLKIDTPAGFVTAHARVEEKKVLKVYFHNVPSFVVALDDRIPVPGYGEVRYDIAFGGAFYAFVSAESLGLQLKPQHVRPLIEAGMAIKRAVMKKRKIKHPFDEEMGFLYGTIFTGPSEKPENDTRNVCVFAEGEVDRSPTGTGVSARLAIQYSRGDLKINQPMIFESIIGTTFTGRVVELLEYGSYNAIIPEVEGTAHITGHNEFIIDPDDPLKDGFIIR
jgi:proline racemase